MHSADIDGAHQIETQTPFDENTNFVDLHLDFPVSFEKYVMGQTPFMMAAQRIGVDEMMLHGARLRHLDEFHDNKRTFNTLLKHYTRQKKTPFKLVAKRAFDVDVISDAPQDFNAALYNLLAIMMWPFALPGDNANTVDLFMNELGKARQASKPELEAFIAETIDTRFLAKLQSDCLDVYPRMLASELALRPALFLDFDDAYSNNPIPMRVSADDFQSFKDLYKDIAEVISRQFVLVAGVNNLIKRGNHNTFFPGIGLTKSGKDFTPDSLDQFAKVDFGKKLTFIDDSWYQLEDDSADNQLRNAIAHFKTEYDDVTQIISYYPQKDGLEAKAPKTISFLEFMRRILTAYREMHRLHHLIKALFYYRYLLMDDASKQEAT
ncbi:MAG: hypothetical protein DHS20C05_02570 [Hyphococcus sp.]|nr:MAG: hypothetical protein DHS20C05_02570 [Marinicaulis sp.]